MAHTFTGKTPTKPSGQRQKVNLPRTPPYYLKWHPLRWQCIEGEWLPQLGRLVMEPGIGGVDSRGNTQLAEVAAARRGWTIIPWEVIPDTYLQVVEGTRGPVYLSRFLEVKQIGTRAILKTDKEGWLDFLRMLMDEGIITPPDPDVLEFLTDVQRKRYERILGEIRNNPARKARLAPEQEKLAGMEAGIVEEAEIQAEAAPAPKPKKRRTRKAAAKKRPAKRSSKASTTGGAS